MQFLSVEKEELFFISLHTLEAFTRSQLLPWQCPLFPVPVVKAYFLIGLSS
jgi:hypothetical protein